MDLTHACFQLPVSFCHKTSSKQQESVLMPATSTKPKREGERPQKPGRKKYQKKKWERKTKLENGEKQERILGAKSLQLESVEFASRAGESQKHEVHPVILTSAASSNIAPPTATKSLTQSIRIAPQTTIIAHDIPHLNPSSTSHLSRWNNQNLHAINCSNSLLLVPMPTLNQHSEVFISSANLALICSSLSRLCNGPH